MECKNCDNREISVSEILFPVGKHPSPKRTQDIYPFPVVRCRKCEKLNEVMMAGADASTVQVVDEGDGIGDAPNEEL